MKRNKEKLRAYFAPETRFEVAPVPPAPFRAFLQTEFEKLRTNLLKGLLEQTSEPDLHLLYRHAANEAASLAAATGFPLLVLPVLLDEKAEAARQYARLQTRIVAESAAMTEALA